jgi:hypothetical protein
MFTRTSLIERFKADPPLYLVVLFALVGGLLFLVIQTSKLFQPQAAEAEMLRLPLGRFDWGFVWADTLVPMPMLIGGALCVLWSRSRLGLLLIFGGCAINLYATIFLIVGFDAVGKPVVGADWVSLVVLALLGVLCMIYAGRMLVREYSVR